jgi:hypothetical protein
LILTQEKLGLLRFQTSTYLPYKKYLVSRQRQPGLRMPISVC